MALAEPDEKRWGLTGKADSTVDHLDISFSGSSRTDWLAEPQRTVAEFEHVFVFSNCLPQP